MTERFSTLDELGAAELRMARNGLALTVRDLAILSGVNKSTVVRVEAGEKVRRSTLDLMRGTLEKAGAVFFSDPETGIKLVGLRLDTIEN